MPQIVLVDDDQNMVTLLRTLLEIEGYVVGHFDGTENVLSELKKAPPHFVLLDVNLKGSNGLDIIRLIRGEPDLQHMMVAMTSGMDLAMECMQAGADHFLMKPYMPDVLLDLIRNNLGE